MLSFPGFSRTIKKGSVVVRYRVLSGPQRARLVQGFLDVTMRRYGWTEPMDFTRTVKRWFGIS